MLARLDELLARHRAERRRADRASSSALRDEIDAYRDRVGRRIGARERRAAAARSDAKAAAHERRPRARSRSRPRARGRDRVRVVTAASLFDGHDAAINIMRRLLQAQGAEVIHLGHDRSVEEIAAAAVQEDARAVAVSSYQGGHMEFFRYLVERLARARRGRTSACTAAAAARSRPRRRARSRRTAWRGSSAPRTAARSGSRA